MNFCYTFNVKNDRANISHLTWPWGSVRIWYMLGSKLFPSLSHSVRNLNVTDAYRVNGFVCQTAN